ncbi:MAG: hypothetical protein AB7O44_26195, partial [Hyphomicrobiaceae bacterium]
AAGRGSLSRANRTAPDPYDPTANRPDPEIPIRHRPKFNSLLGAVPPNEIFEMPAARPPASFFWLRRSVRLEWPAII